MPQTSCGHVYSKLTLLTSRPLNSNTYVFLFVWSKCGCKKHGLFWRTGGKRGRKGLQWTAVGAKAQMVGDWTLSLDSDQITSLNLTSCSDSEGLGLLESPAHHFADRCMTVWTRVSCGVRSFVVDRSTSPHSLEPDFSASSSDIGLLVLHQLSTL